MNKIILSSLLMVLHTPVLAHESRESMIVHALQHVPGTGIAIFLAGFVLLLGTVIGVVGLLARRSTQRS